MSKPTPLIAYDEEQKSPLFIKREDLSETGSHKFRYFKERMEQLKKDGVEKVVLSTTGNAGITASYYGKALGIQVLCLMHELGDQSKAAQIQANGGILILSERPIRFSKYISKKFEIPLLRMSADEQAIESYKRLGEEIIDQAPDTDAIVNFCTSGTSTLGIATAYEEQNLSLPAFHVVQSGRSNSVVKELHPEQIFTDEESVGLETTPHHAALMGFIKKSQGDAWYISQADVQDSKITKKLAENDLHTSWEGQCSFLVGEKLQDRYQQIVVIFSGKAWPPGGPKEPEHAEDFSDLDRILSSC